MAFLANTPRLPDTIYKMYSPLEGTSRNVEKMSATPGRPPESINARQLTLLRILFIINCHDRKSSSLSCTKKRQFKVSKPGAQPRPGGSADSSDGDGREKRRWRRRNYHSVGRCRPWEVFKSLKLRFSGKWDWGFPAGDRGVVSTLSDDSDRCERRKQKITKA